MPLSLVYRAVRMITTHEKRSHGVFPKLFFSEKESRSGEERDSREEDACEKRSTDQLKYKDLARAKSEALVNILVV